MCVVCVCAMSQIRKAERMNKLCLNRTFRPANDLCTSNLKSHVSRVPDFFVNGKLVNAWACCLAYATMTIVIQSFSIICVHVPHVRGGGCDFFGWLRKKTATTRNATRARYHLPPPRPSIPFSCRFVYEPSLWARFFFLALFACARLLFHSSKWLCRRLCELLTIR